tara:strand:- start:91409 stop:92944 length:1536 start_codon:yes stop_codon:yes gene_type:complete
MRIICILTFILLSYGSEAQEVFKSYSFSQVKKKAIELKKEGREFKLGYVNTPITAFHVYENGRLIKKFYKELPNRYLSPKYKVAKKQIKVKRFILKIKPKKDPWEDLFADSRGLKFHSAAIAITGKDKYEYSTFQNASKKFSFGYKDYTFNIEPFLEVKSEFDQGNEGNIDFFEFTFQTDFESSSLSLGRQIVQWGVFDELSGFDILTATRDPYLFFWDGRDLRLPKDIALWTYYGESSKWDFYLEAPRPDQDYTTRTSTFEAVDLEQGRVRGAADQIPLLAASKFNFSADREVNYGLRLSTIFFGIDTQLLIGKILDENEEIVFSPAYINMLVSQIPDPAALENGLMLKKKSRSIYGVSFQKQLESMLAKLEVTAKDNYEVLTEEFKLEQATNYMFNLGLEGSIDSIALDLFLQFNHQEFHDQELLLNDKQSLLILEARKSFLSDRLGFAFRTLYNTNDGSNYLSPQLNYSSNDMVSYYLKYFNFQGDPETFFGFNREDHALMVGLKVNL